MYPIHKKMGQTKKPGEAAIKALTLIFFYYSCRLVSNIWLKILSLKYLTLKTL